MRYILIGSLVLWLASCASKHKTSASKDVTSPQIEILSAPPEVVSPDTIPLHQIDGSLIHLIGIGNIFVTYTETIDGYTLSLNKEGIYEYSKRSEEGNFTASGVAAHDPGHRDKNEEKFLKNLPKHLRYEGAKLQEILQRQKKLYTPAKKLKKNEK